MLYLHQLRSATFVFGDRLLERVVNLGRPQVQRLVRGFNRSMEAGVVPWPRLPRRCPLAQRRLPISLRKRRSADPRRVQVDRLPLRGASLIRQLPQLLERVHEMLVLQDELSFKLTLINVHSIFHCYYYLMLI